MTSCEIIKYDNFAGSRILARFQKNRVNNFRELCGPKMQFSPEWNMFRINIKKYKLNNNCLYILLC